MHENILHKCFSSQTLRRELIFQFIKTKCANSVEFSFKIKHHLVKFQNFFVIRSIIPFNFVSLISTILSSFIDSLGSFFRKRHFEFLFLNKMNSFFKCFKIDIKTVFKELYHVRILCVKLYICLKTKKLVNCKKGDVFVFKNFGLD